MFYKSILLPLLTQVLLTFLVWVYLYITRLREMRLKNINPQQLAEAGQKKLLLTDSLGPSDNFQNLLEMPLLFYLAVLLSLVLLIQDEVLVQLAWGFVLLRAIHSLIHCTYNRVIHRFWAYFFSCLLLLLMWYRLALYILTQ
ncbi:MAG TPA: MAPEG family protein [Xanthomonadales bacterium]|nr:MAPEG family protein [Xanthomonadales bacterium]